MNHQSEQTIKLKRLQQSIRARKGLIGCGLGFTAVLHQNGHIPYIGSSRWGQGDVSSTRLPAKATAIAVGTDRLVVTLEDGNLAAFGRIDAERSVIRRAACVRRVACGPHHTAILMGNGRVIAGPHGDHPGGAMEDFPLLSDLVCGEDFTVGLTGSGHVIMRGGSRFLRHTVRHWQDVAGIFTDYEGRTVYGITAAGNLLSTAPLPHRADKWKNLVSVAAASHHIWAVTASGQLLSTHPAARFMDSGRAYVACAACEDHAVALTRDGEVVATGKNDYGQCKTAAIPPLFGDFEEFASLRRSREEHLVADERIYQIRLVEATRNRGRIATSPYITACLTADGRLIASATPGTQRACTRTRAAACGNAHILALHTDGHVTADGNNTDGCCNTAGWHRIKAVAAGKYHSIGLGEDGFVYFAGRNDCGQGDILTWSEIRAIRTSDFYTVGVTYGGRILVAGKPPFDPAVVDDPAWYNPVDLIATSTHLVCLYANGHVHSTLSRTPGDAADTSTWRNVRAIAAERMGTWGLCYGGTVLAAGFREDAVGNHTDTWRHVVAIGCGDTYSAALTAEGRLLLAGILPDDRASGMVLPATASPAARWRDVITLSCGPNHIVALTRDGQISAAGSDTHSQCSAARHFILFRDIRQLYGYGNYRKMADCAAAPESDATADTP